MHAPDFEIIWMLICCVLVLFMQAGFLCMETGLVRTKNAINVALKNFADLIIAAVVFYFIGATLINGTSHGGIIGFSLDYFNFSTSLPPRQDVKLLFELLFIGTTATIIGGAVIERMNFRAYLLIAFVTILVLYPPISHWVNNDGGWLKQLGVVDLAGATYVHSVGGWVSLAAVMIVGPRLGRFSGSGFETGNFNFPLSALGVMILWVGWVGFNSGHAGNDLELLTKITVNTILGGIAGGSVIIVLHVIGHARGDAVNFLFAIVGGLVSITAGAHVINHFQALVIGAVGALSLVGATILLERLEIDDGIGVVSTHLVPATWGMIAIPIFASSELLATHGGFGALMLAQLAAIVATGVWSFSLAFVFLKLLDRILPLRVSHGDEVAGLDLSEHGVSSEFDYFRRKLEAQLSLIAAIDTSEPPAGSEMGQLLNNISRVLGVFEQRKEVWLGQLAQAETSRGLLSTRTNDLEKALVISTAGLHRKSQKISEIGAKIASLVAMIEDRKQKQLQILSGVTQMTATPLKQIATVNRRAAKNGLSVQKAKTLTQAVSEHCDAVLRMLEALEVLLEVELMPHGTNDEIVDIKQLAHDLLRDYGQQWRDIEFSVDITSMDIRVRGNQRYLTSMIKALLDSATTERGTSQVTFKVHVDKGKLAVGLRDDGKALNAELSRYVKQPLDMLNADLPEPTLVHTVFLGVAHSVARMHGGQLNLDLEKGSGLDAYVNLPAFRQNKKLAS